MLIRSTLTTWLNASPSSGEIREPAGSCSQWHVGDDLFAVSTSHPTNSRHVRGLTEALLFTVSNRCAGSMAMKSSGFAAVGVSEPLGPSRGSRLVRRVSDSRARREVGQRRARRGYRWPRNYGSVNRQVGHQHSPLHVSPRNRWPSFSLARQCCSESGTNLPNVRFVEATPHPGLIWALVLGA